MSCHIPCTRTQSIQLTKQTQAIYEPENSQKNTTPLTKYLTQKHMLVSAQFYVCLRVHVALLNITHLQNQHEQYYIVYMENSIKTL